MKKSKLFSFFLALMMIMTPVNSVSAQTLYAPDGRTIKVHEFDVQAWCNVGWYEYPVITVYAPDGRNAVISRHALSAWESVGWYSYPVVVIYAPDGRSAIISADALTAYESVGWFDGRKTTTVYNYGGQALTIPLWQLQSYLQNGWKTEAPSTMIPVYSLFGQFDAFLQENTVMVPFERALISMGTAEDWMSFEQTAQHVAFFGGDSSCYFYFGQNVATQYWSDGQQRSFPLRVAPILKNGVAWVPLETLCQMWGDTFTWDATYSAIYINGATQNLFLTEEEAKELLELRIGDLGTWDAGEPNVLGYYGTYSVNGKDYYQFRLSGLVNGVLARPHYTTLTWYVVSADGAEVFEGQCMHGRLDIWAIK